MAHLGWELGSAPLPPPPTIISLPLNQEERNQEMRCPMGTVWGPPRRALCHSNPSVNTGHNQLGAIEYRERGKEEGRLSWVPGITNVGDHDQKVSSPTSVSCSIQVLILHCKARTRTTWAVMIDT